VIKSKTNKKKISLYSIFKFSVLIVLIILVVMIFYELYKSKIIKIVFLNNIEKFSVNYGYFLSEIQINNLKNIENSEIEKYFSQYIGKSIFLVPIQKISKDFDDNKWIDDFTIKNDYKNKIIVNIIESIPVGIHYDGEDNLLFDKNGEIIDLVDLNYNLYSNLILFKGDNSLFNANFLLNSMPLFLSQIREAIFINNRRWNLKLKNGISLKLAESNIVDSINKYIKFHANVSDQELREIALIDLRVPQKIILQFKEQKDD